MGVEAYDADIDNSLTRLKMSLRLVEEANDMLNLTNKGKLVALHVLKKEQNLLNILERVEEEILRSHIPKVCLGNECELKTRYIINYELIHPLKASELVFPRAISLKTASLTVSQQIECSLIKRKEPQETPTVPEFKVSEEIKLDLYSKALAKEVLSAKVEESSHPEIQVAEEYTVSETMGECGGEDIFELLFDWPDSEELNRFRTAISTARAMCVFLIPAPGSNRFPGELIVRKILATEFKRAYGDIEAAHDTLSDLSEKSKHVITISSEKVAEYVELVTKILRKTSLSEEMEELKKYLEDLMSQMGIYGEEKKLIVFCPTSKDINPLFGEVSKRISLCFKLIAKYGEDIPREDFVKIIRSLAWLLSIDRDTKLLKGLELYKDLDEAFRDMDQRRIELTAKLKEDEDWIHIRSWEGENEEHRLLKLLAYKTLKDLGHNDEEIKVEEVYKVEDEQIVECPVPDLHVEGEIWIEIETLRGIRDPLDLIQKYQRKAAAVSEYKEFWLVIPSFEIMMHRDRIPTLLRQLFSLFGKQVKVSIWYPDLVNKRIRKLLERKQISDV